MTSRQNSEAQTFGINQAAMAVDQQLRFSGGGLDNRCPFENSGDPDFSSVQLRGEVRQDLDIGLCGY
ncbi:MAG: hypothetical protein JF888_14065 [Candidatus Dormibacteraeota bacterium]|uniref:Uncharacterized protein n=1 Tax=Candidatus Dormiibacter inghamiae TaxID=3127013 RepID=A0A934KIN4_9BACT|nr:hypothetical protein [Candidatus Dormibacteraeota bacterium]MBJ7605338.1 hypothetical protein [Candidatus Dormibacteraeota bacterium]